MKIYIVTLIIVIFCSCEDYKINPSFIKSDYTVDTFNTKLIISYKSEYYISYKKFENSSCFPIILYHSKYFDKNPFFAYRTIPVNIDSDLVFIDHYGKGIDSLNYETLDVQFFLNGKQKIVMKKVHIINECYAIGNDKTIRYVSKKEIPEIAKKWNLKYTVP